MIPFLGTVIGAACVFFCKGEMNRRLRSALSGFAGGIMVAASVWSLMIPAIERASTLGQLAFLPAAGGCLLGALLLLLADRFMPAVTLREAGWETHRMLFAITLHNLPEGMAVGTAFAGAVAGSGGLGIAAATVLAIGVGVQNVPEGAIVSMPLRGRGMPLGRAFCDGVMSGVVEPIGAVITLLAASVILPILPLLLGFAAGAMLYVVVCELIPEVMESGHADMGNLLFIIGFLVMMSLDVALG
jgi:ZIP family zinc transporter